MNPVPPLRTAQGQAQAAWIRERWRAARDGAGFVGLTGQAAERAAVQSVALWLLATGPAHEWNWNASSMGCAMETGEDCANLASVDPGRGVIAAFRTPAAHAAAWWELVREQSEGGIDFVRWLTTLDASAAYRFDLAWSGSNAAQWPEVTGAVRTVANAVAVTGWTFPALANSVPAEYRRAPGGGTTGGSSGGGSTGGGATTRPPGGTTTSGGGGTTGPTAAPRRRGGGAALALLALLAVVVSGGSKGKR